MKASLTVILSLVLRLICLPLKLLPIKKNQMLFFAMGGGSNSDYVCNPKYICEEVLRSDIRAGTRIIWITKHKQELNSESNGIRCVNYRNPIALFLLLISGVVITNGPLFSWFPFRKKQYKINTWHGGGAYKKLPADVMQHRFSERYKRKMLNRNVDLFLSSSRGFTDYVIRGAMGFKGDVLSSGMPRNDLLINNKNNPDKVRAIKSKIGIKDDRKVLLIAPTFRYKASNSFCFKDISTLLTEMNKNSSDKWLFMCRNHKRSEYADYLHIKTNSVIDVSDYDDMQELLLVTDFLITDYSSSMWDYALLGRPGLLYVPDWEEYSQQPGLYLSLEELPFDAAFSFDELVLKLADYIDSSYNSKPSEHIKLLGSYEKGNATSLVLDCITKVLNNNLN